ncbi:phosphatidate phosphatase PAH1 KNAG_0I00810 [Huiozyma naganishii CBS 8797]|uniref:LNS2/PITP domain-containing protein n=1 Tax=Huiozyma naganishii (strain ATCC MYA-139 / BCRC 22969 / CBS 8797 / KCTC 17520 / NBRC 10181 / NCYC 3082 / Yp74L-3) TaxID=1071383 RepID=J7S270_HUIN7|nr:hypothetical protein KNAG_0I00810 [Kazachstania naganishii CBS 8797]CCK71872.1 hypothetical protein KNAG_0I00810 [Kazachstania naganishii CBS 8797]
MQYVGRAIGSVSKTWSSINPATLSGAIDVIVVEQPDGTLQCSPFHVRFGKFQILKPSQKKVEVIVNDKSTNIPMKLSETGEAYFVFETYSSVEGIPSDLIGSPVVSPVSSPELSPSEPAGDAAAGKASLNEPEYLNINDHATEDDEPDKTKVFQNKLNRKLTQIHIPSELDNNGDLLLDMEGYMPNKDMVHDVDLHLKQLLKDELGSESDISKFIKEDANGGLRIVNPYEHISSSTSSPPKHSPFGAAPPSVSMSEPSLLDGRNDDEKANVSMSSDTTSKGDLSETSSRSVNSSSDVPDQTEKSNPASADPQVNYIKTLRLTSDQLSCLGLKYGENDLTYSIENGRAVVTSKLFVWRWDVPIVISDIDGTITKSDALGHVLAMIGKDWTHVGVAKLFNEIARNGYNIMYLTARSAGQSDSTRSYLRSIDQNGYRLPLGPVILSPDRTMAALRREVILKKPEVFKIACLNDIRSLYFDRYYREELASGKDNDEKPTPFFAGFGNRITDALSYRTVGIPSSRIFTINTEGDVHMELLELAGYKSSYLHINELVDHFFPPVAFPGAEGRSNPSTTPGSPVNNVTDHLDPENAYECRSLYLNNQGEKFTDANFWREPLLDLDNLSDVSADEPFSAKKNGQRNSQTLSKSPSNATTIPKSTQTGHLPDENCTRSTPSKNTQEDIGQQMYLTLGSPLSSPTLDHIDTTNIDSGMKALSISKPALPLSAVSKVNVLDDVHSVHTPGPAEERTPENSENDFYDDEFDDDDDEFDEDEFLD